MTAPPTTAIATLLVDAIPPDRAAAIGEQTAAMTAATKVITDARLTWSSMVEDLARINLKALKSRMQPAYFSIAGRVRDNATLLRGLLDRPDAVDATTALRAARESVTNGEFASAGGDTPTGG